MRTSVVEGDCREVLAGEAADSYDACVCDPPYELGFMSKEWDQRGVAFDPATWAAVLRVLKPGAHLVAFGGTRTHHRLMCAIEDAGFEVRDALMWIYGSGFPKSHSVDKAIDKANGDPARVLKFTAWLRTTGITAAKLNELTNTQMGSHFISLASQPAIPTRALWKQIRPALQDIPAWVETLIERIEAEREVIDHKKSSLGGTVAAGLRDPEYIKRHRNLIVDVTIPATPEAEQWQGWGTALKPAWEPVILARKPLSEGNVAANVLRWGTGAINVGGCRIGTEQIEAHGGGQNDKRIFGQGKGIPAIERGANPHVGRWPANLILAHDPRCVLVGTEAERGVQRAAGSPGFGAKRDDGYRGGEGRVYAEGGERELWACVPGCPARMLDEQSGRSISGANRKDRGRGGIWNKSADGVPCGPQYGDSGGASRFFYTAKSSSAERVLGCPPGFANRHPTVKPLALMRWLVRLVAPPGGVVLDPFAGSGSTLVAAMLEGHDSVGIDSDLESVACARGRIAAAEEWGEGLTGLRKVRVKRRRFRRGK